MTRRKFKHGGDREGAGRPAAAGVARDQAVRYLVTPGEAAEIRAAVEASGRSQSDVAREFVLAWAREINAAQQTAGGSHTTGT